MGVILMVCMSEITLDEMSMRFIDASAEENSEPYMVADLIYRTLKGSGYGDRWISSVVRNLEECYLEAPELEEDVQQAER
jgi:hypothetical protein